MKVTPGSDLELLGDPEFADALGEDGGTDAIAQHQEEHRRLPVAQRRPGDAGPRTELAQAGRRVAGNGRAVAQPAEAHGLGGSRRFRLLVGIVGHEGGQPLGPVAALVIDVDAVAPPVVEDFVSERGLADEGQAQDVGAEVGQGRHPEAGGQRAGDDRELGERIGADFAAVAGDVGGRIIEIALGQAGCRIEFRGEEGAQGQRRLAVACHGLLAHDPGAGHEVDAVGRPDQLERCPIAVPRIRRQGFGDPPPGHQGALPRRHAQGDAVGEQLGGARIPAAAGGQETALGRGHRRHAAEHAAMVALPLQCRQLPSIADAHLLPGAPGTQGP